MGASRAGSYEVTPPGRSRASDAAHRADRSTQRQQPTRQAYGESYPTGDATPILTRLRHCRIDYTDQPASTRPWAPSKVERHEEPERVVAESSLLEADGGPEFQHLIEGNSEDEL